MRSHNRSTYQISSKAPARSTNVVMTRSRTASPIPEEHHSPKPDLHDEPQPSKPSVRIPAEYISPKDASDSELLIPRHYKRSMRPSSMPLASLDSFSRRITPMGFYDMKDRMWQERQFATVVLGMLMKHAYEESGEEGRKPVEIGETGKLGGSGEVKMKVKEEMEVEKGKEGKEKGETNVETEKKEAMEEEEKSKEAKEEEANLMKEENQSKDEKQNEIENQIAKLKLEIKSEPSVSTVTTNESSEAKPSTASTASNASNASTASTASNGPNGPTGSDARVRKVSIVDQIKRPPPSLKPTLHLTNPDTLFLQLGKGEEEEDYRVDRNAPKTPANAKGKRSALHMVPLSTQSFIPRRFFPPSKTRAPS